MEQAYMVLWRVPAGHISTVQEAAERLTLLRSRGSTSETFAFAARYGTNPSFDDSLMLPIID